jgi:hypothetical protein
MIDVQVGGLNGAQLDRVTPATITRGIAATPMNEFVLWTGDSYSSKAGSRTAQILGLVNEAWKPVALRDLILRAARIDGELGFTPEAVRDAIRQHQRARGCCYLWVRGSRGSGFVLVTNVSYPATDSAPWRQGRCVSPGGARHDA